MSAPDASSAGQASGATTAAAALAAPAFAQLPRDAGGPVFAEPWQAQAFALAVRLADAGCFTWAEWAQALGAQLRTAAERGEPDDGSRYYEHWLAALEQLVTTKGLFDPAMLHERKHEWAAAHRATPHGQPVELAAGKREARHAEHTPRT